MPRRPVFRFPTPQPFRPLPASGRRAGGIVTRVIEVTPGEGYPYRLADRDDDAQDDRPNAGPKSV